MLLGGMVALLIQEAGGPVRLEWKFREGHIVRYQVTVHATSDIVGLAFDPKVILALRMQPTFVGGGGRMTLELFCERVRVENGGRTYDSAGDEGLPAEPLSRGLALLCGRTVTMTMDRSGRVLRVEGADRIAEQVAKEAGGTDFLGRLLIRMLTNERMKGLLQQVFPGLPRSPLREGDRWSYETRERVPVLGRLAILGKAHLKSIRAERREAVLVQDLELKPVPEPGGRDPVRMLLRPDRGTGSTEIVWSIGEGRLRISRSETRIRVNTAGRKCSVRLRVTTRLVARRVEY